MRVLLVCLLLWPLAASARIVAVSNYTQLQSACVTALPGDTILLAAGVYSITNASRIMITNRPGPVLVKGASGNRNDVIVEGAGQDDASVQMVFNLDNAPDWTFRDITTRRSYYHGFKFDHASTNCRLINVVMRDHGESGVKGTSDPAAGTYPDGLLIDSCDIGFTSTSGGTRSVVEGVDGVGVNDWIIRNSRFVNIQRGGNVASAIFTKGNSSNTIIEGNRFEYCFIGASFGGGGTGAQFFRDNDQTYEHRNGIIRNNLIMRCTDAGIYINKGHNCRIYNNTVFECELTIQLRYVESTGYVRNNLVKRSLTNSGEPVIRLRDGATMLANEANLAASDADFVQPSGGYAQLNLRLSNTSAAVDAGVNVGADVATDFEGQPRPVGAAYDVGADEFGSIPVELLAFTAAVDQDGVRLRWSTASERNSSGFFIDRSADALRWFPAAFLPSGGNSHETREYEILVQDPELRYNAAWLRLRERGTDGRDVVLAVLPLPRADEALRLEASPNPARDRLTARMFSVDGGQLSLTDALGRVLYSSPLPGGYSIRHIDAAGLLRGVCFLRIITGSSQRVMRVVLE